MLASRYKFDWIEKNSSTNSSWMVCISEENKQWVELNVDSQLVLGNLTKDGGVIVAGLSIIQQIRQLVDHE